MIAESNPGRYGWMYGYSDEVYTGLDVVLQSYYLKHYSKPLYIIAEMSLFTTWIKAIRESLKMSLQRAWISHFQFQVYTVFLQVTRQYHDKIKNPYINLKVVKM